MYWNNIASKFTLSVMPSWIVTLDVLKCQRYSRRLNQFYGWIVTLDVLKYNHIVVVAAYSVVE